MTYQWRQFEAGIFKTLATITGSYLTSYSLWHLTSNGITERLHRQLKVTLICYDDNHWTKLYRWFFWKICNMWKEELQASSEKVV